MHLSPKHTTQENLDSSSLLYFSHISILLLCPQSCHQVAIYHRATLRGLNLKVLQW